MSESQTKPIRILRLIARLNVGGPAIHVSLLTQKFSAPGYESTLACGSIDHDEGDMLYYAEERGVTPVIIPELGRSLNPVRDLVTVFKVFRLIRQLKPDVVHTHTAKAGFVGRVAAWMAGVPVIVHTFHGHVFQGYFSPTLTRIFLFLERTTARMTDSVITLSDGLRRELTEDYRVTRKSRITVLPLGLDLHSFIEMPRKQGKFRAAFGIDADVPLIGIVGRLVPVKNHALFLQAAARVLTSLPDARFAVVGDGRLRADLEVLTDQLGLRDRVIFTGWLRDLADVYSDLDALVISSVNEGTPVSVIEALASGCPVVGTRVGGLPDILEGGALGTLVPSGDAEALAVAITDAISTPPNTEQSRWLMNERYGIDRLVHDLDALYRGLLARKRFTRKRGA